MLQHEYFMRMALAEAEQAYQSGEVPVGAVIVSGEQVIARAHNQREMLRDPTAHAEILAITQAAAYLESWRLLDCRLYCTLEPCPMCAGAIIQARIPYVLYGATDAKGGAVHSLYHMLDDARLNHRAHVTQGLLAEPCGEVLIRFFRMKRQQEKND